MNIPAIKLYIYIVILLYFSKRKQKPIFHDLSHYYIFHDIWEKSWKGTHNSTQRIRPRLSGMSCTKFAFLLLATFCCILQLYVFISGGYVSIECYVCRFRSKHHYVNHCVFFQAYNVALFF